MFDPVRVMLFLLVLAAACPVIGADESKQQGRPNIVLIISDDQTYTDFGFMGNSDVQTPHIDQLASQSARFVGGYVPSSVCRPSLATLLMGLYPHQHGIHFNHPPPGFSKLTRSPDIHKKQFDQLRKDATYLIRQAPTLPRLLAKQGYRCFQTGKHWEGHWRNAGFTEGMTVAEPSGGKNGDKALINGDIVAHGNGDHGLAIGRETMQPIYDFIDDCGETPFLVWYAPFLPHTPHDAPQKYFDIYKNNSQIPKHRIPYYASISQFDQTVGDLVQYVEQRGLAKNTIFVFVVDNGWEPDVNRFVTQRNEWDHTKRSKRAPFDFGLRTPILIRWDQKTKAATIPQLVNSVDIVPTLLAAVEIESKTLNLPGKNLFPAACGKEQLPNDRAIFGEVYPGDATSLGHAERDIAYRWVRKKNFKLIVPHATKGKPPWNQYLLSPALFDVARDHEETKNLIKDKRHEATAKELQQLLDRWWLPEDVADTSDQR